MIILNICLPLIYYKKEKELFMKFSPLGLLCVSSLSASLLSGCVYKEVPSKEITIPGQAQSAHTIHHEPLLSTRVNHPTLGVRVSNPTLGVRVDNRFTPVATSYNPNLEVPANKRFAPIKKSNSAKTNKGASKSVASKPMNKKPINKPTNKTKKRNDIYVGERTIFSDTGSTSKQNPVNLE